MKISISGLGYVGLSNALLLAKNNEVIAYDSSSNLIKNLKEKKTHLSDQLIKDYLNKTNLNINFTHNIEEAYVDIDYAIISIPTDFDNEKNTFNTYPIELLTKQIIKSNPNVVIVIKSTVPIGFTKFLKKNLGHEKIIFSPEFLREGFALFDNLNPSRIIAGGTKKIASNFVSMLKECADKQNIDILITSSAEAEAIKLFSNAYLAMRIGYFNELDSYAETKQLSAKKIIEGVSMDPRIGQIYNNPSFGYGGYCLPKDTKQLKSDFKNIKNNLITAIIDSNETRKKFIANSVMKNNPKIIGVYRLIMKKDSDNFRESSIQGVIEILKDNSIEIIIFEPKILEDKFQDYRVVNDLKKFKDISDIIIANRMTNELVDIKNKVYSRDIFNSD